MQKGFDEDEKKKGIASYLIVSPPPFNNLMSCLAFTLIQPFSPIFIIFQLIIILFNTYLSIFYWKFTLRDWTEKIALNFLPHHANKFVKLAKQKGGEILLTFKFDL